MVWLITFTCYGTHFHDPPELGQWEARQMKDDAYRLDPPRRRIVLRALLEVCKKRGWPVLAAHVRTTHVHILVALERQSPKRAMNEIKAESSKLLNGAGIDEVGRRRWTRHGSTVPVDGSVVKAIEYVADRQGSTMQLYVAPVE